MDKTYFIKLFGTSILMALFINTFIGNITYVKGSSMNPSLSEGDRLLLRKYRTILNLEKYNRRDIVVFKSPKKGDKTFFIKRIIGIEGDRINILDGEVYINDEHIDESYIEDDIPTQALLYGSSYMVSSDEVFVIGDNRLPGQSNDSRLFRGISIDSIKGKIVLRIYPLSEIKRKL